MSRATQPANIRLTGTMPKTKNRGFNIPQAGGNRTQAPLTFIETTKTDNVVWGVGALQRSANDTKELIIKCITYNVESLNMERHRQICGKMRKAKYNLAMIQGTRWNLTGSIIVNGYQIYAAPAAKISTEAHAGVCVIIDQQVTNHTKVTYEVVLEHRIVQIRLNSSKYDIAIITAYSPREQSNSGSNYEKQ